MRTAALALLLAAAGCDARRDEQLKAQMAAIVSSPHGCLADKDCAVVHVPPCESGAVIAARLTEYQQLNSAHFALGRTATACSENRGIPYAQCRAKRCAVGYRPGR